LENLANRAMLFVAILTGEPEGWLVIHGCCKICWQVSLILAGTSIFFIKSFRAGLADLIYPSMFHHSYRLVSIDSVRYFRGFIAQYLHQKALRQ